MHSLFLHLMVMALVSCLSSSVPIEEHIGRPLQDTKLPVIEEELIVIQDGDTEERNKRILKAFDRLLSSNTAVGLDKIASSVVRLAGGVVDDVGDFVVQRVDQLPSSIQKVGDIVEDAIEKNTNKALLEVKGVRNSGDEFRDTSFKKISTAVENSHFHSSLKSIEDSLASLFGKLVGTTYKNADHVSNAFGNVTQKFLRLGQLGASNGKLTNKIDILNNHHQDEQFNNGEDLEILH